MSRSDEERGSTGNGRRHSSTQQATAETATCPSKDAAKHDQSTTQRDPLMTVLRKDEKPAATTPPAPRSHRPETRDEGTPRSGGRVWLCACGYAASRASRRLRAGMRTCAPLKPCPAPLAQPASPAAWAPIRLWQPRPRWRGRRRAWAQPWPEAHQCPPRARAFPASSSP